MSADLWHLQLYYAAAWASFGLLHSVLARGTGAAALRAVFGSAERLAYNAIAAGHLLAVFLVGRWLLGEQAGFARPDWLIGLQWAALLLASLIGLRALKSYDLALFAGTKQLRAETAAHSRGDGQEPLVTDGLHRYVRHPLYTAVFLFLWGLVSDPLSLATAVWGSLYLLVGTYFEERKLIALYGQAYGDYRRKVPAFLPWRGRAT